MHPSVVRQHHASRIFHTIRLNPDLSQREIADLAEVDKSTVSTILKDFEDAGLIVRSQRKAGGGRGRPGDGISIAGFGGLFIGIHPVPWEIHFVVAGLDGVPVGSITRPMPHHSELAAHLNKGIDELVASISRSRADVRAVGISVLGLLTTDGYWAHSPNFGWRDIPLRKVLEEQIQLPLFIDNSANADALAEHMFGAAIRSDNFIYVSSESGVGSGIFLDGSLYRGSGGFAGEFGHTKVVPNGRLCRCGNEGCVSAYVSDFALHQRTREAGIEVKCIEEVAQAAADGDPQVIEIVTDAGTKLGLGLSNMVNMFNPSLIVLGGGLLRFRAIMHPFVQRSLDEMSLPAVIEQVTLQYSALSPSDTPRGGLALALEGCTIVIGNHNSLW
ncbi:ROK family transcriptional regulator [Agrobacterium tumefaciens]|uniref:ROK family transcriptional regulator n=1 Tax=Agrobacterium tumefaciens TaxID=358 RepID=UPI0022093F86|nr:ROK family transcriptional regulator [Agrobacterium tumefaciens]UXT00328.1 ROK family transcriptional regulator [Agrobacterium tumefaciens]